LDVPFAANLDNPVIKYVFVSRNCCWYGLCKFGWSISRALEEGEEVMNSPLVSVFLGGLRDGHAVHLRVLGRDLGEEVESLLGNCGAQEELTVSSALESILHVS
jgi:hypothetical protein